MKPPTLTPALALEYIRGHPGCNLGDIAKKYAVSNEWVCTLLRGVRDKTETSRGHRHCHYWILGTMPVRDEPENNTMITQPWISGIDLDTHFVRRDSM